MAKEAEIKLALLGGVDQTSITNQVSSLLDQTFEPSRLLINTYFDTPSVALNYKRVALRIREFEDELQNKRYIQTLKNKGFSQGGLHVRGEWECNLTDRKLNSNFLSECEAWPSDVEIDELREVFQTNFNRTKTVLDNGRSKIEIALDLGVVSVNDRSIRIAEIELELVKGQPEDLFNLAIDISRKLPVVPFDESKAERGYYLSSSDKDELDSRALAMLSMTDIDSQSLSDCLAFISKSLLHINELHNRRDGSNKIGNFFVSEWPKLKAKLVLCIARISKEVLDDEILCRQADDVLELLEANNASGLNALMGSVVWGQLSLAISEKIWRQRSR